MINVPTARIVDRSGKDGQPLLPTLVEVDGKPVEWALESAVVETGDRTHAAVLVLRVLVSHVEITHEKE